MERQPKIQPHDTNMDACAAALFCVKTIGK